MRVSLKMEKKTAPEKLFMKKMVQFTRVIGKMIKSTVAVSPSSMDVFMSAAINLVKEMVQVYLHHSLVLYMRENTKTIENMVLVN